MRPTLRTTQRPAAGPVTTVVIGAGHAGLAMSACLTELGIDHVVLERGEVANSWRHERWDSLRLLTPNWQSALPGMRYDGADPDGYMSMPEVIEFLDRYARLLRTPLYTGTTVTAVTPDGDGYRVTTNRGDWRCRTVVLASGACNLPVVPAVGDAFPAHIASVKPSDYRNTDELPDGGVLVVGASATGVQLADEIQRSGRQVVLAVGEHVRMPRTYRGKDIQWWMDATGVLDERYDEVDDLERARRVPSPQLIGSPNRASLDLNTLQERGVQLVGRLAGLRGDTLQFSGSLANHCAMADLKMGRLLERFEAWRAAADLADFVETGELPPPTRVPQNPRLTLDLGSGEIRTVVWATGFRPDYHWLKIPVLDHKGRLRHDGGVVDAPGLYAMGLTFMRRRKSSFIHGAEDDARALSAHLKAYLDRQANRSSMIVPDCLPMSAGA